MILALAPQKKLCPRKISTVTKLKDRNLRNYEGTTLQSEKIYMVSN